MTAKAQILAALAAVPDLELEGLSCEAARAAAVARTLLALQWEVTRRRVAQTMAENPALTHRGAT